MLPSSAAALPASRAILDTSVQKRTFLILKGKGEDGIMDVCNALCISLSFHRHSPELLLHSF